MLEGKRVFLNDMKQFCFNLLVKSGATEDQANAVSDGLCETSYKGIDSHGVKLLPHYIAALSAGRIKSNPDLVFDFQLPTAGRLNADHTFGHHAGVTAVNEGIKRARDYGMCSIAVYNSSHFGAAGYFAEIAARQSMACLSFTHADSLMKSHNGVRPYFGTNPIAFSIPMANESPYYLDLATTMSTWNRVKNYRAQGLSLEPGWAFQKNGEATTDANKAAFLAPMGEYKGYALASMVEIFCSIFTGMPFGRSITSMYEEPIENHRYLGQFYIIFNLAAFGNIDLIKSEMQKLAEEVRNEPPAHKEKVRLPGDPQKEAQELGKKTGILVPLREWEQLKSIAKSLNLVMPKEVS